MDVDAEILAAQLILNKNLETIRALLKRIDGATEDETVDLFLVIAKTVGYAFQLGAVAGIRESKAAVFELTKSGTIRIQDNPKPEMN